MIYPNGGIVRSVDDAPEDFSFMDGPLGTCACCEKEFRYHDQVYTNNFPTVQGKLFCDSQCFYNYMTNDWENVFDEIDSKSETSYLVD